AVVMTAMESSVHPVDNQVIYPQSEKASTAKAEGAHKRRLNIKGNSFFVIVLFRKLSVSISRTSWERFPSARKGMVLVNEVTSRVARPRIFFRFAFMRLFSFLKRYCFLIDAFAMSLI